MEVRCSSCSTEYEFDDALVSARGTSVKCTNCGHQFRVHAPAAAAGVAERWMVRDARGKETTYTSLRELQQAIVKGLVDPKHEMSHGNQPFRPLQDIYELQTFFEVAKQRAVNQRLPPRTLLGVGRDAAKPGEAKPARQSVPPPRKARTEPMAPAARDLVTPVGGVPAVDSPGGDTIRQPRVAPRAAVNEDLGGGDTIRQPRVRDDSHPHHDLRANNGSRPPPDARGDSGARPLPRANAAVPGTAGPGPARHSQPPGVLSGERLSQNPLEPPVIAAAAPTHPWQQMQGLHDEPPSHITGRRGAGSKWIVAVLFLGTLGLLGATVGREYLVRFVRREPAQPVVDQRVPALLEQARTALLKGDFEKAHGELAKASVLAEAEPAVATAIARLEVARTEPTWLRLRILGELEAAAAQKVQTRKKRPSAAEVAAEAEQEAKNALEKKQLELSYQDRMGQVKNAVSAAVLRAPESPEAVRAKVDSLRLAGMVKDARALVGPIAGGGTEPDNAYTLGALDLVESEAGLPSALERLRTAARTEEGLGKARALLIYALARSGDAAGADAELDKLQVIAPQHPALAALRSLVELAQSKASPEPEPPAVAASALPTAPAPRPSAASGEEVAPSALGQAAKLHREGDLDGAEKLYQGVLSRNPKSIPALSGLGDIARQRHQAATAAAFYDQILKQNRNHVPTLMARADLYWAAGNRILAVALYRRALSQVDHSDPTWQRAMTRIEEYEREGAAPTGESSEAVPSEPAPEAEPSTDGTEPPAASPTPSTPSSPAPGATPPGAAAPAPTPRDSTEAPAPTRRRLPPIGGVPVTPGGTAPVQAPVKPPASPPGGSPPVAPAPAAPPSGSKPPGPSLSQ